MAPLIDDRPPITTPMKSVNDRKMPNESGATNCTTMAPSAPAMPVYMADTPKVIDLTIAVFTPMACAATG